MRICKIEIENFRGIQKSSVVFPQHSVLLGANNAGKSAIAEALTMLAGRERMAKPLCDWDFFGGSPKPESRFTIIATITDFGDESKTDPTDFPDWFAGERSATPVWWNEKTTNLSFEIDPPVGSKLAAQIALAGRYDDEACEFETIRFFYDGKCDPFTDQHRTIPTKLIRELGLFLLPSNREWEHLLAFGSASFLKLLREYNAVPGKSIEELKNELRALNTRIEDQAPLREILESAEQELRSFLLVSEAGRLVYRATSLDSISVLRSLIPHVLSDPDGFLPVARHGAGVISLQAFLLLLAFGERRTLSGQSFILVAEEPELHLHPSLHRRLVQRIRAASTQSLVTTQSPGVAASYQPSEAIFVRNVAGQLSGTRLRTEPINQIPTNSIRNLYLRFREQFYEALMGGAILIPEGQLDYEWMSLWQRVAEASPVVAQQMKLRPISFIPTSDAAVVDTYLELARFRPDALPLVDGDPGGQGYLNSLTTGAVRPKRIVRFGADAAIEYLSAWILEPSLTSAGGTLATLLPNVSQRNLKSLQGELVNSSNKKSRELHENLAWEALENDQCALRAGQFFADLAAIASGGQPSASWSASIINGVQVFVATHVSKV